MGQAGTWPLETEDANSQVLGVEVKNLLNDLRSSHSGSSEPSTPVAGQFWLDTSVNPDLLKYYDGAAFIIVGVGGHHPITTATTATVTVTANDDIFLVDASSNVVELDLPTAVGIKGKEYVFIFIDATNAMVIDQNGGEAINGITTPIRIPSNNSGSTRRPIIKIVSDNAGWQLSGGNGYGIGDVLQQANDDLVLQAESYHVGTTGVTSRFRKARGTLDAPLDAAAADLLHIYEVQARRSAAWQTYFRMTVKEESTDQDAVNVEVRASPTGGGLIGIMTFDAQSGFDTAKISIGNGVHFMPGGFGGVGIVQDTLTATTNDWDKMENTFTWHVTADAGGYDLTGLKAPNPVFAQQVIMRNVSANSFTLKHQDAGSSAANRFFMASLADIIMTQNRVVQIYYDLVNSYWFVYNQF